MLSWSIEHEGGPVAIRVPVAEGVVSRPGFVRADDYAHGCEGLLGRLAAGHRVIVTLEDGVLDGGFGERCARELAADDVRVLCYGLPRAFVDRYEPAELLARCNMTVEGVTDDALRALRS